LLLPPAVAASAARKSRARRSLCFFFFFFCVCVCVRVEREWEEGGESALEVESPFLFRLSIRGAPRKKTARFPQKSSCEGSSVFRKGRWGHKGKQKSGGRAVRASKRKGRSPRDDGLILLAPKEVLTQFLFSPSQPLTIAAALLSFSDARGKRSESAPKRKKGRSIFGHTRNETRTRVCDWKTRGPAADVGRVRRADSKSSPFHFSFLSLIQCLDDPLAGPCRPTGSARPPTTRTSSRR